MMLFLLLLSLAHAQSAQVTFTVYGASQGGICSTAATGTVNTTFTVNQCTGLALNSLGFVIAKATSISATSIVVSQYDQADISCSGPIVSTLNLTNGQCFARASGGDARPAWTTINGGGGSSSARCFHEDTVITYEGTQYVMGELLNHPECAVPHVVSALGVTVVAQCGLHKEKVLRLTDGHLLYTQRGLVPAGHLMPSHDTLYANIDQSAHCEVVSVTKETHEQRYFGLNCLKSHVLAGGIKASTFEKLHSLPAFWMRFMGHLVGIKRASAWGDRIADMAQQIKLI